MKPEYKFIDSRISWRFDFVLVPFDLRDLLSVFKAKGYTTPQLPEQFTLPPGARIGGSGIIATKNGFGIFVDTDKQVIGVNSTVGFGKLLEIYDEVKEILSKEFNIDFSRQVRFCELLSTVRIKSDNAIDNIRNIPFKHEPELEKIVGEYGLVGFRIGSKINLPTQDQWFDIEVHPVWTDPNRFYEMRIVYRGSEKNVLEIAKSVENIIPLIVKLIGGA